MAAALGARALADQAGMRRRVEQLRLLQERLADQLELLGWPVRRTPANFILVGATPRLRQELARRGLVVRAFAAGSSMADWVRVTVRAAEENDRLVEAVRQGGPANGS